MISRFVPWSAPAARGRAALAFLASLALCAAIAQVAGSYSTHVPVGATGAPGEDPTVQCIHCHATYQPNTGGGALSLTLPDSFAADTPYTVTVTLTDPAATRWGFQLTALDASGARAGDLVALDTLVEVQRDVVTNILYASQLASGTFPGVPAGASWAFQWTAPAAGAGPVTFFASGVSADYDLDPEGDHVYTITRAIAEQSTPVAPATWGALKALYLARPHGRAGGLP